MRINKLLMAVLGYLKCIEKNYDVLYVVSNCLIILCPVSGIRRKYYFLFTNLFEIYEGDGLSEYGLINPLYIKIIFNYSELCK